MPVAEEVQARPEVVPEHPILFSAQMVREVLSGRKTQTRRIVTVPWKGSVRALPYEPYWVDNDGVLEFEDEYGEWHDVETNQHCPYGRPGHRLWVKETWRPDERKSDHVDGIRFRADGSFVPIDNTREAADRWVSLFKEGLIGDQISDKKWRPSIYMPRWASRILLDVKSIRVHRIQTIRWHEIRSEGVRCPEHDFESGFCCSECPALREAFRALWDSINGKRFDGWARWEKDPWVWAIEFKRIDDGSGKIRGGGA